MSQETLSGLALRDRKFNSFFQDNVPLTDANKTGSPAVGQIVGGVVNSGTPVYAHGDGAPFLFNTSGELKVDTEISVSGVTIDNIKVFSTNNTVANSLYGRAGSDGIQFANIQQLAETDINLDDAAFGVGTDAVLPTGFLADETSTDSVDEGDIGIARMTLDRRQVGASDQVEDAAFAVGEHVTTIGGEADDPNSLPAVTEADVANIKTDLQNRMLVRAGTYLSENDTPTAFVGASSTVQGMNTLLDEDADNTAQAVKTTPGNLYNVTIVNGAGTLNGVVSYLQLFDLATGDVTVGTTTPKYVIPVPANGFTVMDFNTPMQFNTAITYALTTTPAGATDPTNGGTLSAGYR